MSDYKVIIVDDGQEDKSCVSAARMHFDLNKIPYEVILIDDLKEQGIEPPKFSNIIFPAPPLFDVKKLTVKGKPIDAIKKHRP